MIHRGPSLGSTPIFSAFGNGWTARHVESGLMIGPLRVEETCFEPGLHREGYLVFSRPPDTNGAWELIFGKPMHTAGLGFRPELIRPAAEVIEQKLETYRAARKFKADEVQSATGCGVSASLV